MKYSNIGDITDSDRHCLAVIGPFTHPPVFRCEYQYSGHGGIISGTNEDAPEAGAKKSREGSTGFLQYCYLNAIADWLTKTQQKFLITGDIDALLLAEKSVPWDLDEFNNTVYPSGYAYSLNLMRTTWLFWPDKVLNVSMLFEDADR